MAILGRGKQGGSADSPRAASGVTAMRYESQAEPSLGAALERKWEEAWRRARAADYNK